MQVMMVTDQLLGRYDQLGSSGSASAGSSANAGGSAGGPAEDGGGGGGATGDGGGGGGPGAGGGAAGDAAAGGGGAGGGGPEAGSPVQICSLLAHLLLLAAGGGVGQATALCDTFGGCRLALLRCNCGWAAVGWGVGQHEGLQPSLGLQRRPCVATAVGHRAPRPPCPAAGLPNPQERAGL